MRALIPAEAIDKSFADIASVDFVPCCCIAHQLNLVEDSLAILHLCIRGSVWGELLKLT